MPFNKKFEATLKSLIKIVKDPEEPFHEINFPRKKKMYLFFGNANCLKAIFFIRASKFQGEDTEHDLVISVV